jgi:hypothetical protein
MISVSPHHHRAFNSLLIIDTVKDRLSRQENSKNELDTPAITVQLSSHSSNRSYSYRKDLNLIRKSPVGKPSESNLEKNK